MTHSAQERSLLFIHTPNHETIEEALLAPCEWQSVEEDEAVDRIELTDAEVERLVEILNRAFSPTPALRKALSRLTDPKRQPPKLRWQDERQSDPHSL
jgi:hypothetical protein